jgi:hypothetical protein
VLGASAHTLSSWKFHRVCFGDRFLALATYESLSTGHSLWVQLDIMDKMLKQTFWTVSAGLHSS